MMRGPIIRQKMRNTIIMRGPIVRQKIEKQDYNERTYCTPEGSETRL